LDWNIDPIRLKTGYLIPRIKCGGFCCF